MSRKLPPLKPKRVVRILERHGFWIARQSKHITLTDGVHVVTVPRYNHDLPTGTLRSIISQAGWTIDEFLQRL
jgi:predicted RNA binding protein YcfA (HicA-like mRNA interferase family)